MFTDFTTEDYLAFFEDTIKDFGGVSRGNKKYIFRKNVGTPFPQSGAYFGCINDGEESTGAYSDLSIVVFPSNEPQKVDDRWLIALGVGTLGFKNDYHIVSLPGTRRIFVNCLSGDTFTKNDFMDIETKDGFSTFCENHNIPETLSNAVKNYRNVLLVSTIFNPNDKETSNAIIKKYLALYANIRCWPTNNEQKRLVRQTIQTNRPSEPDEKAVLEKLLKGRKYVVIQGAPGTGKTHLAKEIVKGKTNVFFTQFHAETSYSDFVYGILPDVNSQQLKYSEHKGVFVEAISKAVETDEEVYLIIDEINRANLSNVLGPAFYLFEPSMSESNVEIEICPGLSLKKLPNNLFVIATMNTADRSLAVVDFALRRRFAWYTLYPRKIQVQEGNVFREDEFYDISSIFEKYATDEELNLQPGHAYFIVPKDNADDAMKTRLKYEIMPLIKEYLADGMLSRAKDDFVNYFRRTIGEEMYR